MRIARIALPDGETFAVSTDAQDWLPLPSLGIDCDSTASVMLRLDEIASAVDGTDVVPGHPDAELLCPVLGPTTVIAIGLNYHAHADEVSGQLPDRPLNPMTFAKFTNSLAGPNDPIVLPAEAPSEVDYEVELAVVLQHSCRDVPVEGALDVVGAVAVANDVSARDLQFAEGQFSRAKSFDTFCPIGPWLTTMDTIPNLQNIALRCTVNGEVRQDSNTSQMIFDVAELVSFLSRGRTLHPGDVILTGTPSGVALGGAHSYLRQGDVVVSEAEGVGKLRNKIVAE